MSNNYRNSKQIAQEDNGDKQGKIISKSAFNNTHSTTIDVSNNTQANTKRSSIRSNMYLVYF
jgi:hypothetical protein